MPLGPKLLEAQRLRAAGGGEVRLIMLAGFGALVVAVKELNADQVPVAVSNTCT